MGIHDLFAREAYRISGNVGVSPKNGARRGPDMRSVIVLEIMRAPGNVSRLFAETQFQCCAVHLRNKHDSGRQNTAWKPYENLIKQILLHCPSVVRSFLTADATTNVDRLGRRSRNFSDDSSASLGHCASPRGDVVIVNGATFCGSRGNQAPCRTTQS